MGPKKRRLGDLYVLGREVTVDDGQGPITVWIQKLNPLDTETSVRRANVAKSRVAMAKNDRESEEWLSVFADVCDLDRDQLIDAAIIEELAKAYESADAEISAEDEWAKDGYLDALRDSWADKLFEVYQDDDESDPDLEEAKKVFAELKRFDDAVTKRVEGERDRLRKDYQEIATDKLIEQKVEQVFTYRSDAVWVREWHRCQIWLGTRQADDHKQMYFAAREEVDALPAQVLEALRNAYESLTVDISEGKGSPPIPSSSPQPEALDEQGTAASSGLQVVNQ